MPSKKKVVLAIASIGGVIVLIVVSSWFWDVLVTYVKPRNTTDRKDVVQVYVLILAGVVGGIGAAASLVSLYFSRKNLEQQREIESQRRRAAALQAYYEQIGKMLSEQNLRAADLYDDVRLLASAQTKAVLQGLDPQLKRDLILFLWHATLIDAHTQIIDLGWADLTHIDLRGHNVFESGLTSAYLNHADLSGIDLSGSDMQHTRLHGANLRNTDLSRANLHGAMGVTNEQLEHQARDLSRATMPDGRKYEDWRLWYGDIPKDEEEH